MALPIRPPGSPPGSARSSIPGATVASRATICSPISRSTGSPAQSAQRNARMASRIAVAIAARPGGAGLGEPPCGAEALPHAIGKELCVGLGSGPQGAHLVFAEAEQLLARRAGIDDAAADEIGRGAG